MDRLPINAQTRPRIRPKKIRGRIVQHPANQRALPDARFTFLRHHFQPIRQALPGILNAEQVAADLSRSLTYLCRANGLNDPPRFRSKYPRNVLSALTWARQSFRDKGMSDNIFITTEAGMACLAIERTCARQYDLYYFPIDRVLALLQNSATVELGRLFLVVMSYLYQEVEIPYYREPCYLNYTYSRIREMVESDPTVEKDDPYPGLLDTADTDGDIFYGYLRYKETPTALEQMVTNFKPKDKNEADLLATVKDFLQLRIDFPGKTLTEFLPDMQDLEEASEDEDAGISFDCYISFIHSAQDELYTTVEEWVNQDFQERSFFQDAVAYTVYDRPNPTPTQDLTFPNRLFKLMDEFSYHLFKLP